MSKGYWKLPHEELYAALRIALTDYERRVYLALADATRGYQKERDIISAGRLANATGIAVRNVHRTLRSLEKKGLAHRKSIEAQKVERWATWPATSVSSDSSPVSRQTLTTSVAGDTLKERGKKEEVGRGLLASGPSNKMIPVFR